MTTTEPPMMSHPESEYPVDAPCGSCDGAITPSRNSSIIGMSRISSSDTRTRRNEGLRDAALLENDIVGPAASTRVHVSSADESFTPASFNEGSNDCIERMR
eukprot:Amastigsp_a512321_101.p2 type:complete len:102 gc:universal Amastigsp_a512321_101:327-22(-)